jgi:hypothetical protein
MKRVLSLLVVVALMVLVFAPVATAQYYGKGGGGGVGGGSMATSSATSSAMSTASSSASASMSASATSTATSTATASATPLPKTGGPPLVGLLTLVASVTLISSGVGALLLVRRTVS